MAQSPVFERMLLSGMKETQTNTIEISDFRAEVVEAFIKYVHVHKIEIMDEMAEELLVFADKYEVIGDLKASFPYFLASLNFDLRHPKEPENLRGIGPIFYRLLISWTGKNWNKIKVQL